MSVLKIFVIFVSLAVFHNAQASMLLDRVVAVVNQDVITWSDLYRAMEFEATDKMRELKAEERRKIFKENEAVFLDGLIDMKLQIQAARQLGIDATAEDVNDTINDIKKKYSLDDAAFLESMKKEGFTLDEYKRRLAEQIILGRVVTQQVRNKVVVSESEIEKHIAENKGVLADEEAYRIKQIFFKKPGDSSLKKAVEEKTDEVLRQLKAGEDFSALAKKYSEDPSRKTGGDLGFIKKTYMAREFIEVILQMKIGDVSQPFWTERGLHIIKLEEKSEKQTESAAKETVKNKLAEKKFSDKYKSWLRDLRESAYIEIRL
jgi:peptidyl-prolyl cis-trans isomerase SurA